MSFDWNQYYALAEELTGASAVTANAEARYRSALSRAYYAVFCLARNRLRDVEGHTVPSDALAHAYVSRAFNRSSDPARRAIGQDLYRLRDSRNRADYDDTVPGLAFLVLNRLRIARRVINRLRAL